MTAAAVGVCSVLGLIPRSEVASTMGRALAAVAIVTLALGLVAAVARGKGRRGEADKPVP